VSGVVNGVRRPLQGGAMLVDAALAGVADTRWFDPSWWEAAGAVVGRGGGRGAVWYLDTPHGGWVLRRYRRGGLARVLSSEHYLWTGEARTRAFAEWRLLAHLYAEGLPVPRPVAAAYRRGPWPFYSAWLLTSRLPPNRTLRELCREDAVPAPAWAETGRVLARLHAAGACHTDLNAGNVLVGDDGSVHVLDFDQGYRRAPGGWTRRNLARLKRSLDKTAREAGRAGVRDGQWAALLAGYREAASPEVSGDA